MSGTRFLAAPPVTAPAQVLDPSPLRRGWAWAGLGAGLCGIAIFAMAGMVGAPEAAWADNELLLAHVVDSAAAVWIFQAVTVAAAGLLVVFGAGLRRHLYAHAPVHSLLPEVALIGAALTAAMLLVGGGISTQLFWALSQEIGTADPDTVAADLEIFSTIPWVWAGLGLTSASVAVAALRHGAAQRWIGWVSVGATALVLVTQVLPIQYMALAPASLWLLAAGPALARAERRV